MAILIGSSLAACGDGRSVMSDGAGDETAMAASAAVSCTPPAAGTGPFTVDATGVTVTLSSGLERVQVCQDDIVRVMYTNKSSLPAKSSLSVNKVWDTPSFCVTYAAPVVTITTSRMKAKVNTSTGSITYTDPSDAVVLAEDSASSKTLTATTVEGVSTNKVQAVFASPSNEALFGLGQHQDSVMNRKGTTLHIFNANMEINTTVLVSNKGYGLFWDNASTSDFYGNDTSNTKYRFVSEAGDLVDYYFFYGPSTDRIMALYRVATGSAPMYPKWAYGLFQSKDKYSSQSELLSVKDGYRNNNIPLDAIVQDWNYWDPNSWGSHYMDKSRYPDPLTLMNTLHSANVHGMISIWPEYQYMASPPQSGDQDNYNALNAIQALYPSGGSHHFYDTFNAAARTLVFQQIQDRLVGKYGWDGIWADNTEPQAYPDSVNIHAVDTALGKGAFNINAYPLQHAKALYEGWRSVGPKKRVFVLTRSAFTGQQRYGSTTWSGDIDSNFATFIKQIPAGLNYAASGMPYWTTDIGGYWGHSVDWTTAANNELFTRWFQYGAFCPIFRIHGGGTRELYSTSWSSTTKANLLTVDNLRYRLMPYIYSLAWKVTSDGYTIMRPLVFDYPSDSAVLNIKDQFLFGPAFLVNPVTTAGATSRSVYLPAGTWYDFWTGSTTRGGASATVNAPLSQIPLFVKAGSIVPMGPMIQYASQSADPLELRVYKGQDASFTLYDDAGDTYDYESGQYSTIPITWNETTQQLTIGARSGTYTGMLATRRFNIVWVAASHGTGVGVSTADQTVSYTGSQVVVSSGSGFPLTVTASGSGSVTSSPAGIQCGSACGASFASGTVVTLTASPAGASTFSGWSGACSGAAPTCTVTMSQAQSVTAIFTSPPGTVSINTGGAAAGDFVADSYFSGGSTYSTTTAIDTSLLTGAVPPQEVLQSERYGQFTYTLPGLTPGGGYGVTLYFEESFLTAAGLRLFDVAIGGTKVLTAFDIYATAGGLNKAIAKSFDAVADASGQLAIQFTPGATENPKVCGITVTPSSNPTCSSAPSAPSGLTATPTSTSQIQLAWSAVTSPASCSVTYSVYRDSTRIATALTGSSFTDTGLTAGTTYSYTVRAVDSAGSSAASNAVSATTLVPVDTLPPSAPANLTWASDGSTVALTWSLSTDNVGVVAYELYYGSFDLGAFTDTVLTLIGFKAGVPYTFTVKARDAAGNLSVASNQATVLLGTIVDTTPPSAPGTPTLSSATSSSLTLRWSAATDDVGVVVYQVFVNGSLAATVTSTSATVTGLTPSTGYAITVKALDAAGNVSPASAALSASTSS